MVYNENSSIDGLFLGNHILGNLQITSGLAVVVCCLFLLASIFTFAAFAQLQCEWPAMLLESDTAMAYNVVIPQVVLVSLQIPHKKW